METQTYRADLWTQWEGEGGMIRENIIETYMLLQVK